MTEIKPGSLLISDPFLKDPNFIRTVVLICEHQMEGSLGFVLNKRVNYDLGKLIENAKGIQFPIFQGGPVQLNTLHFIHQCPTKISGGMELIDGLYWGGDFDEVLMQLKQKNVSENELRIFLGYSGWGEGQLAAELNDKSWITRMATKNLVFGDYNQPLWKKALKDLGGEYVQMTNYPTDPQLN